MEPLIQNSKTLGYPCIGKCAPLHSHDPIITFKVMKHKEPQESPESNEQSHKQDLEERVKQLEKKVKENQTNIFSALKNFVQDYSKYRKGKGEFPEASLFGLLQAYFRPRIVFVLGSIVTVILAAAQLIVLTQQNEIIENQEIWFKEQNRVMKQQNVAAILQSLSKNQGIESLKQQFLQIYQLDPNGDQIVRSFSWKGADTISKAAWQARFEYFHSSSVLRNTSGSDSANAIKYADLTMQLLGYCTSNGLALSQVKEYQGSDVTLRQNFFKSQEMAYFYRRHFIERSGYMNFDQLIARDHEPVKYLDSRKFQNQNKMAEILRGKAIASHTFRFHHEVREVMGFAGFSMYPMEFTEGLFLPYYHNAECLDLFSDFWTYVELFESYDITRYIPVSVEEYLRNRFNRVFNFFADHNLDTLILHHGKTWICQDTSLFHREVKKGIAKMDSAGFRFIQIPLDSLRRPKLLKYDH